VDMYKEASEKKMQHVYEHPRPMVTVDAVVFGIDADMLRVLLIQRKHEPYTGKWALPGGFVEMDETLDAAVMRELAEETGLTNVRLEQFHTFGAPDRDPRGRTISVAFVALIDLKRRAVKAADDAEAVEWYTVDDLPELAFDHRDIILRARDTMKTHMRYSGVGAQALEQPFTLSDLRRLHEAILGTELNPGAFQREILGLAVLDPAEVDGPGGVRLYRFNPARVAPL